MLLLHLKAGVRSHGYELEGHSEHRLHDCLHLRVVDRLAQKVPDADRSALILDALLVIGGHCRDAYVGNSWVLRLQRILVLENLLGAGDTIHDRHVNVEDDSVVEGKRMLFNLFNCLFSILCDVNNSEVLLEEFLD